MKIIGILFICTSFSALFAQNQDYLDHNNMRVVLPRSGCFFYNDFTDSAGFEVPKGSGHHFINSMQFRFMTKDSSGTLHATFGQRSSWGQDVFDGPYSSLNNYDSTYQTKWKDKSWQICQEEIDAYKAWWEACEGPNQNPTDCQNITMLSNASLSRIYSWPAHGDTSNGEDYYLAPFFDYNNDGAYNPGDGDYPIIKGCCATWRIDNDLADQQTATGLLDPVGLEMRYMTYQFKNFGLLNNVTFVEVTAINKSNTTYPEFVYGLMSTMENNYVDSRRTGADSTRSLYYMYGGDNNDSNYGANTPAFGIIALEAPLTSITEHGGIPNQFVWERMNGMINTGTNILPITDHLGNVTKFEYHDHPSIPNGYSQEQQGLYTIWDGYLATEHGAFAPGDQITQTFAFVYVNEGDRLQNVDAMLSAADELHSFYDTITRVSCRNGVLSASELNEPIELLLMPNPASEYVDIAVDGANAIVATIIDISGKIVANEEGNGSIRMNTSTLSDGAYFVRIKSGNSIVTKKLIIDQ